MVMEPSQARPRKVVAIKKGSRGMMTFFTMSRMMFWNSASTVEMVPALVHTAARPISTLNTRALITGMICGMSSWNATAGSSCSPSTLLAMLRCGMMPKPAPMDMKAASTLET